MRVMMAVSSVMEMEVLVVVDPSVDPTVSLALNAVVVIVAVAVVVAQP